MHLAVNVCFSEELDKRTRRNKTVNLKLHGDVCDLCSVISGGLKCLFKKVMNNEKSSPVFALTHTHLYPLFISTPAQCVFWYPDLFFVCLFVFLFFCMFCCPMVLS